MQSLSKVVNKNLNKNNAVLSKIEMNYCEERKYFH